MHPAPGSGRLSSQSRGMPNHEAGALALDLLPQAAAVRRRENYRARSDRGCSAQTGGFLLLGRTIHRHLRSSGVADWTVA